MRLLLSSACAGRGSSSSSLARGKRFGVAQDGEQVEWRGGERRAACLSFRREDAGGREVGKRGEEGLGPGRGRRKRRGGVCWCGIVERAEVERRERRC